MKIAGFWKSSPQFLAHLGEMLKILDRTKIRNETSVGLVT